MTNNTPDYNDNLYFDAQNTKNEQQKDLYIKVEKQVWESTLKASMDRAGRIEILEQQLAIAVEAIKAVLHDEFILEHADAGLVMYLTQAEYKIKDLEK